MTRLDDLTIFVPVRDRQENLPMQFSNLSELNCRKIIADSSVSEYDGEIPDGFDYRYFGPMIYHDVRDRIAETIDDDGFVVSCPDDDVLVIDTLLQCLKFMREHPEYSICNGRIGMGKSTLYAQYWKSEVKRGEYDPCLSSRILRVLHQKYPRYYSLARTDVFKEHVRLFSEHPEFVTFGKECSPGPDKITNILFSIMGDTKTLSSTFLNRGSGSSVIDNKDIQKEIGINLPSHARFALSSAGIQAMSDVVARYHDLSAEQALKLVREAYGTRYKI